MNYKTLSLASLAAIAIFLPTQAEARDYCRQYTKTIRIGGNLEIGYGKACKRDHGVWEIVRLAGPYEARERVRERIYDSLYDDDYRIVVLDRYDAPRHYYRPHYYPRHHWKYRKHYKHHKKYYGYKRRHHDHHGHKGHGKGHHKHRH